MKYSSFWWMSQPRSCGRTTLWPRLEIGKSSVIALEQPQDDRLPIADHVEAAISGGGRLRAALSGLEPRVNEEGDADEKAAIPCFTW